MGNRQLDVVREVGGRFEELLAEAEPYLEPADLQTFLYGAYGQLMSSLAHGVGFSDPTVYLAVDVALHASRLSLRAPYLAAALVYYPVLAGRLPYTQVKRQFRLRAMDDGVAPAIPRSKRSRRHADPVASAPTQVTELLNAITTLILLAQRFDVYLPWVEQAAVEAGDPLLPVESVANTRLALAGTEAPGMAKETLLFLATAQPSSVAVLKVLDRHRLHANLDRFDFDPSLQRTIAAGTLEVFAPVAEALGLWAIKSQMEDAAFKLLDPALFAAIASDLQERLAERVARTERAIASIRAALAAEGVTASLSGRPKHIFGLSRKVRQGMAISEVNDAIGVRVVVKTVEECYSALSALSRHFGLVSGLYEEGKDCRDWIARPKANGYQSIHATIEYENQLLEVQIRTHAMHEVAEYGLAAHWVYRSAGNSPQEQKKLEPAVEPVAGLRKSIEAKQRKGSARRREYWRNKGTRAAPPGP
jgi:ppGpp synthetase/RelA/SpoT-type nucleotidyltranferase